MKNKTRKLCVAALALLMGLTGCTAAGAAGATSETATPPALGVKDVTPAQMAEQPVSQLSALPDGSLLFVTSDKYGTPLAYRYADGGCTALDNRGIAAWREGRKSPAQSYFYDATGYWWVVNDISITRISPDGTAQPVVLPEQGGAADAVISDRMIDRGDGTLCFVGTTSKYVDGSDGVGVWYIVDAATGTVRQTIQMQNTADLSPVFYKNDLLILDIAGDTLRAFDVDTGAEGESTPFSLPQTSFPNRACITADGLYSLLTGQALYRCQLGGALTQTVATKSEAPILFSDFIPLSVSVDAATGGYWIAGRNWPSEGCTLYSVNFE